MINKGKMVFCKETFQIFPSAKETSKRLEISYHTVAKNLEGKIKSANGMHLIYIENVADISQFFSDTRKMEKQNEILRKEAEERLAELTATQKETAKEIAKTRKLIKKYM